MRKLTITLLAAVMTTVAAAQEAAYKILHECDTIVKAQVQGFTLGSRDAHYIVYEYPSKDGDGNAVTISGIVLVPGDVANGTVPCDGIILYNRFTVDDDSEVPSKGGIGLQIPSFLLASPLKPNYIVVSSDYIGYGSSYEGHNMAYFCGDINARTSLDGLVAARQMLKDKNLPLGKYQFNIGNSQGATEAMYVAKLRDMEYKDKGIKFDKTFIGGGILDCEKAYSEFVKKDAMPEWRDVAMFLVSANENYKLGIQYDELFKEPVASLIPEFVKKKDKAVLAPEKVGKFDSLHQVLQPAYMDVNSEKAKVLSNKLAQIKIANGWEPDITQNYYITHCRHDNYVPVQCARELLTWMKGKGFKPSLVPGKTSLQTNMLVFKLTHLYSAIFWAVQTLAAIQYWPVVYYEGEQNRYYHDVVKDLNLMKTIKYLESWGIDVRALASSISGGGSGSGSGGSMNIFEILNKVSDTLNKVDLTVTDALQMLEDSGITLQDLMEVINYVTSAPAATAKEATDVASVATIDTDAMMSDEAKAAVYLMKQYEQTLANWFLLGGYDVKYNQWGW